MRKAKSAHEKGFLSNFDLFTKNSPVSSNFDHISQWASFSKKLQKLITLDIVHIFLFPIQGKGKIVRGIRIWPGNFEKSLFSGSNRSFCGFDHYDQPH